MLNACDSACAVEGYLQHCRTLNHAPVPYIIAWHGQPERPNTMGHRFLHHLDSHPRAYVEAFLDAQEKCHQAHAQLDLFWDDRSPQPVDSWITGRAQSGQSSRFAPAYLSWRESCNDNDYSALAWQYEKRALAKLGCSMHNIRSGNGLHGSGMRTDDAIRKLFGDVVVDERSSNMKPYIHAWVRKPFPAVHA